MNERDKLIEDISDWLHEVLITDEAKTNYGLDALFPTIIMCDKYFTVDELTDALKEKFNYGEI